MHFVAAVLKHIFSAAFFAALLALGACAQFDSDEPGDDATEIEFPSSGSEEIWVDGRLIGNGDLASPIGAGACACTSAECFEAWVVDSFGCDVCVTFVCDGEAVAHSCAACNENPLNHGEEWTGDADYQ